MQSWVSQHMCTELAAMGFIYILCAQSLLSCAVLLGFSVCAVRGYCSSTPSHLSSAPLGTSPHFGAAPSWQPDTGRACLFPWGAHLPLMSTQWWKVSDDILSVQLWVLDPHQELSFAQVNRTPGGDWCSAWLTQSACVC